MRKKYIWKKPKKLKDVTNMFSIFLAWLEKFLGDRKMMAKINFRYLAMNVVFDMEQKPMLTFLKFEFEKEKERGELKYNLEINVNRYLQLIDFLTTALSST
jgi:hypothetical protein